MAFCDPRFCLEGLERHAQLAWMLYPWLIKLWRCLLYYWGLFSGPKVHSKAFLFLRFFGQFHGHFLVCYYSEFRDF